MANKKLSQEEEERRKQKIMEWGDSHDKFLPNSYSKEEYERKMGQYLKRNLELKKELLSLGYRDKSPEIFYEFRKQEIMEWGDNHNKFLPSSGSKDKYERKIGNYLSIHRELKKELLSLGYRDKSPEIFYEFRKQEIMEWGDNHDKYLPSTTSTDKYEISMGRYLCQHEKLRKELLKLGYKHIIEKFIPEIQEQKIMEWGDKYDKFLPSTYSKDKYEISMGSYLKRNPELRKKLLSLGYRYKSKSYRTEIVRFLDLHLEDLKYMDKSELYQIAILKKLPKDKYNKLINSDPRNRSSIIKDIKDSLTNLNEEDFENESEEEKEVEEKEKLFVEEKKEEATSETLPDFTDTGDKKEFSSIINSIKGADNLSKDNFFLEDSTEYLAKHFIQELLNYVVNSENQEEVINEIEKAYSERLNSIFYGKVYKEFLRLYTEANNLAIPEGWDFRDLNNNLCQPLFMQKLIALKVKEDHQFGNWSETGTGKTLSAILTSRYIDSRTTLIFAVTSTVDMWRNVIYNAYKDSKVYTKENISIELVLDRNSHNYIVVNYDEFQNKTKFINKWLPFLQNNIVDFVVIDETQKVKINSDNKKSMSIRRKVIENVIQEIDKTLGKDINEPGRLVSILALTATPVINTLSEVASILSLLRGVDYNQNQRSEKNAMKLHLDIVNYGIRIKENPYLKENVHKITIRKDFTDAIKYFTNSIKFIHNLDQNYCLTKLMECDKWLEKGVQTIIYTESVKNIDLLENYLIGKGLSVKVFTGSTSELDRIQILNEFKDGKFDIILASKPIATGVDMLQEICNRVIILVPSWTYADYHQLVGRINRKGSKFTNVDVIIPCVEFETEDNKIWSLDNERLNRIRYKQDISDMVMDGYIPDKIITRNKLFEKAVESFKEITANYQDYEIEKIEYPSIAPNL